MHYHGSDHGGFGSGALTSLLNLCVIAVAAAVATAAVAAPFSAPGGAFITSALLLLPALLIAAAIHPLLSRAALRARGRFGALVAATWCARDLWLGATCLVFLRFVDAPRGLHAIGASTAAGVIALFAAWRLSRLPRLRGRDWLVGCAALAATGAVELGLIDALTLREEYAATHGVMLAGTLLLFAVGFSLLACAGPRARAAVAVATGLALAGFGLSTATAGPDPFPAIMASHSPHARVIAAARLLFDRDGDGYSPLLGGGDCDDRDPAAFPLSTVGRDCLGWMERQARAAAPIDSPAADARPLATTVTPSTVVLVTVDAFRCGFGASGRSELRDLCPGLTRLAAQGWARLDAHANFPLTARSMTALQTGDLYANPVRPWGDRFHLATFFAAHGFATHAIITHPYVLADREVRASFQSIDESLIPEATAPGGATAERVTDRVLATLAAAHGPTFIWAHYLDPHAPYVREDGDLTSGEPTATYGAEVRRTDGAIARLAAALARRSDAARTLLFVTADHGEAFGEHGLDGHGIDLHEEVLRVPMIAWTAGGDHRALGDAHLPTCTSQVAAYLTRPWTGEPPPPPGDVFARVPAKGDTQLALITQSGWKLIYHHENNYAELYDLARDPAEAHDLAASDPARVSTLGGELAAYLRGVLDRKASDLADRTVVASGRDDATPP